MLLLAANAGVPAQDNQTRPLHEAAASGDVARLKQEIAKGANLNELDLGGQTALTRAVEMGQVEAVKILLEADANVNAKRSDGRTPLLVATMNAQKELVDLLLAKGADVKAKDDGQWTALHAAAATPYLDLVEALVKAGADVNATDATGRTPLMIALQTGRTEIATLLRQNGAKEPPSMSDYGAYGPDSQGTTQAAPGLYAARAKKIEIDPNAIRAQMKQFEGLAATVEGLDLKSDAEQRGWAQRRADNRTTLLTASERQFGEELALVKKTAEEDKAAVTAKAVDELTGVRKKRAEAIGSALRDQRREALQNPSADTTGRTRGRAALRSTRGRYGDTGQAGMNPYGGPGAKMPTRRGADANEPVLDAETQALIGAWVNARVEDKKSLLDAVQRQDVADLSYLHEVAEEEQAKKAGTTILALLMIRAQRVEKIEQKWKEDDARQQKLQERYGPGGLPGTAPDSQTGTRRPVRRR